MVQDKLHKKLVDHVAKTIIVEQQMIAIAKAVRYSSILSSSDVIRIGSRFESKLSLVTDPLSLMMDEVAKTYYGRANYMKTEFIDADQFI